MYLAEVGQPFASALPDLISGKGNQIADAAKEVDRAEQLSRLREPDLKQGEGWVEIDVRKDPRIPDSQREAMIQAPEGRVSFAPTCRASSAHVV